MQVKGCIRVDGRVNSLYLNGRKLAVLYTPQGSEGIPWVHDDNLKMIDVGMPY